jgi:hypothetical protein
VNKALCGSRDPDIVASFKALRRAARRARELAFRTGTPFIVFQNGRVVNLNPAARQPRRPKVAKGNDRK